MEHLENIEGITEKYSLRSNRKDVVCVKQQIYYKYEKRKNRFHSIQNLFERKLISSNLLLLLTTGRSPIVSYNIQGHFRRGNLNIT